MLRINFLPPALRPKIILNLDMLFAVSAVVSAVTCAGLFLSVQSKSRRSTQELTRLESRQSEQQKLIDELKSRESQRDLSATQSLAAKRVKWTPFLKELSFLLPNEVWLTHMIAKDTGEEIDMQLMGLAPSQKSVNQFLATMERAPSYQNVSLNSSVMQTDYTPTLYAFDFSVVDIMGTHSDRLPASTDLKK